MGERCSDEKGWVHGTDFNCHFVRSTSSPPFRATVAAGRPFATVYIRYDADVKTVAAIRTRVTYCFNVRKKPGRAYKAQK